mmetsp:Transcript_48541/g.137227  ORF Transcript_48541/g.137227 Transcript_48541/m.137227 type:complete len:172 (-) Transcript_48541:42-557(-)
MQIARQLSKLTCTSAASASQGTLPAFFLTKSLKSLCWTCGGAYFSQSNHQAMVVVVVVAVVVMVTVVLVTVVVVEVPVHVRVLLAVVEVLVVVVVEVVVVDVVVGAEYDTGGLLSHDHCAMASPSPIPVEPPRPFKTCAIVPYPVRYTLSGDSKEFSSHGGEAMARFSLTS